VSGIPFPRVWKSKTGHLTIVLPWFPHSIKIYQADNPTHAEFIKEITFLPKFRNYFPLILTSSRNSLVAEWVGGVSYAKSTGEEKYRAIDWIIELQTTLHHRRLVENDVDVGFDYLDYLERRIQKYFPPEVDRDMIRQLYSIASSPPVSESRLSHPDITLRNIVLEKKSGNFKIVDNELLTQTRFFLLDIFNTCYSLSPDTEVIHYYLSHYSENLQGIRILPGWELSLAAAWALRIAGSDFQAGRYEMGVRHLENWKDGNNEIIATLGSRLT
jgi:hypothetical protein